MAETRDVLWTGDRPAEHVRKGFRDVVSETGDCPLVASSPTVVFFTASGLSYMCWLPDCDESCCVNTHFEIRVDIEPTGYLVDFAI